MKIKKINNQNIIIRECNTPGICRFSINMRDFKQIDSNRSQYFLICKRENKGYLIPANIIKKYTTHFKGRGSKFPLAIDPDRNQIVYQGNKENVSKYCKSGKKEIASILDKLNSNHARPLNINVVDPLFQNELDDLIEFIENKLKPNILKEIRSLRIFTEADLLSNVYKYLTHFLNLKNSHWLVKCCPKLHDMRSPDILIYYNKTPLILFELKFKIWEKAKHFPYKDRGGLKDDKSKIIKHIRKYKTIRRAYIFAIFDAYQQKIRTLQKESDKHYYREIFTNVSEFGNYNNWKAEWIDKRDLW